MSQSEDELFNSSVVPYKILVLCVGNTCRSIMYQSMYEQMYNTKQFKNKYNTVIYSGGFEVKEDNFSDESLSILKANDIPLSKQSPNSYLDYKDIHFDEIILLDEKYNKDDLKDFSYKNLKTQHVRDPKDMFKIEYLRTFAYIYSYLERNTDRFDKLNIKTPTENIPY